MVWVIDAYVLVFASLLLTEWTGASPPTMLASNSSISTHHISNEAPALPGAPQALIGAYSV
jgi:hypothetical protein